MVSTVLEMSEAELTRALARIKREHGDDPEYREFRREFPKTWPL